MVALPGGLVAVPGPRDVRRGDLVQGAAPGASRPQGACPVGGPVLGEPTSRADRGLVGFSEAGAGGRRHGRPCVAEAPGVRPVSLKPREAHTWPALRRRCPDAAGSRAGLPGRRAGGRPRRSPGRGHGLTWGVSNVLKRPDFSRFLSWCVEVRGATGEPRAAHRHMVPQLGQKESPAEAGFPAAMSAFLRIRSASPRTADAAGRGLPRPVMTQRRSQPYRRKQSIGR